MPVEYGDVSCVPGVEKGEKMDLLPARAIRRSWDSHRPGVVDEEDGVIGGESSQVRLGNVVVFGIGWRGLSDRLRLIALLALVLRTRGFTSENVLEEAHVDAEEERTTTREREKSVDFVVQAASASSGFYSIGKLGNIRWVLILLSPCTGCSSKEFVESFVELAVCCEPVAKEPLRFSGVRRPSVF